MKFETRWALGYSLWMFYFFLVVGIIVVGVYLKSPITIIVGALMFFTSPFVLTKLNP